MAVLSDSGEVRVFLSRAPDVTRARRAAIHLGRDMGLPQRALDRLDVVVSELVTNVVRHAGRGVAVLTPLEGERRGVELCCWDEAGAPAPAGSEKGLGLGLASARELADSMEISEGDERHGMCVTARVFA